MPRVAAHHFNIFLQTARTLRPLLIYWLLTLAQMPRNSVARSSRESTRTICGDSSRHQRRFVYPLPLTTFIQSVSTQRRLRRRIGFASRVCRRLVVLRSTNRLDAGAFRFAHHCGADS
jgi:hypothetical protein